MNAMSNTQHKTIVNICKASYKEQFLENVNIGGKARLVRAVKPTAGKETELNKRSKCSRNWGNVRKNSSYIFHKA
jgi:hypothetical protein